MSVGRKALFRLSQNLSHPIRRQAIDRAKNHFQKRWLDPLDFKLMGFVTETKSLEIIPECLNCGNIGAGKNTNVGFGGTIPWICPKCNSCGLLINGLEGYKRMFKEINWGFR